jgi:protein-disulfide isomerase
MRVLTHLSILAFAAILVAPAPNGSAPAAAAAERDWTKSVEATPDGGFRIGNPNAPIKLVEYASLTCSHCAHFKEEGVPQLLGNYVKSGKVSFELRNYVRDAYDMAGALLSRCAGVSGFFPLSDRILATQSAWIAKGQALSSAEREAIKAMSFPQQLVRLSAVTGFDDMAAAHGVPANKVAACLSNENAHDRLGELRRVAEEVHGIHGTPSFLINGKAVANVHDWTSLEPLLKRPAG